ncbi:MAG: alanine racemase [Candidatus Bathyarchaeia archaeon]
MSLIGKSKNEIETPALLIDIEKLEKNIKTMGDYYRSKPGAALLPHQKGHRLPLVARKQMAAGAKGVCMTSFGLAEYYVQSGIDNILITAEIADKNKIRKLCRMSKLANITTTVDNIENVRQISEEAIANNTRVNVAVELYAGRESCGVEFDNVKAFVKEIEKYRGVHFRGIWHHGEESSISKFEERKKEHFKILDRISVLKDEIEDSGTEVELVSAGYTCTWNITPEYSRLRDVMVQAGSYVFSDWCSHHHLEGLTAFDYALTVLTRCISRPKPDEALFDFGMNSCSDECGENYHNVVGPRFKEMSGVDRITQREEIALAVFKEPNTHLRVGDAIDVIPSHSDATAKMHDKYYVVRNEKVEAVWTNYGRGLF